jgi:ubiquinone/menaquinone biosynthesis C-methylase UbiE
MILRKIYYLLSPNMRIFVRKVVYFPIDLYENNFGKKTDKIPNKGDIFIGSGDFVAQGKHQLELLKTYTNLQPNHNVLDIGSGIGRTAFALKNYLSKTATYDGFDVVEKGVVWCQKNITNDFPNFNFKYTPLNNDLYYLTDKKAEKFTFPYEDNSFDTIFLFSVFTHMQPLEVQNYLNEMCRVLKPNGKCLATFFVYNNEIESFIASENGTYIFPYKKEGFRLMNEKVPSANIAFEEENLKLMLKNADLKLNNQINGNWKDKSKVDYIQDFQDVLVFEKQ